MRIFGLAVLAITLTGCGKPVPPIDISSESVSVFHSPNSAPQSVLDQVSPRLDANCLALFNDDRYQTHAQSVDPTPVFAVAFSEDKKDMVCAFAAQNHLRTISESNTETALTRCEEIKPIWEHSTGISLGKCQIFAKGNAILDASPE